MALSWHWSHFDCLFGKEEKVVLTSSVCLCAPFLEKIVHFLGLRCLVGLLFVFLLFLVFCLVSLLTFTTTTIYRSALVLHSHSHQLCRFLFRQLLKLSAFVCVCVCVCVYPSP